jgi:carbamoyltransferase
MAKQNSRWILGISASHNGAACLLKDDEIVVAIQEERLTRVKRDRIYSGEQSLSVPYCLNYAGIKPQDLSLVVLSVAGRADDEREDIRQNPLLKPALNRIPTITIPHHLAHAISAFATSGFRESAILVVDGKGSPFEDLTEAERGVIRRSVAEGSEIISLYGALDTSIVPLEKHMVERGNWLTMKDAGMPFFESLGGMFAAVAQQIFGDPAEAGKVMGLAPYGNCTIPRSQFFRICSGNFHFRNTVSERFSYSRRWPANSEEYENLACSVQAALEEGLLYLVQHLRSVCKSENLCYAGGVALNSVANERIFRESGFKRVHITPAAEDSGPAIGAAYHGLWELTHQNTRRQMVHDSYGRLYAPSTISAVVDKMQDVRSVVTQDVISEAVGLLCNGKILGWFDGRSEIGPRALGQRSIICDPRRPAAKEILNSQTKKREAFRPFAPAILLEEVENWFEADGVNPASPFMLRVCKFRPERRAQVPAVIHVDNTGRLQTITREVNGRFYELVRGFYEKTGVPILLNTSFNAGGEPIVETPEDAIRCLVSTGLDACVFEDRIVFKYLRW